MSIKERAEAWALEHTDILTQGWNQFQIGATKGYIAGATEERALIEHEKIKANTPPENVLNSYETFAENSAHQTGFLIGCEWKAASLEERVKELEEENAKLKEELRITKLWL